MARSGFSTGIDTARVAACFMVVVLHVAADDFDIFEARWSANNFYDSFTRSCVPIFLMISGVLLLGKQETIADFFKKRFLRILPPLLFWSLFYMAWNVWQGEDYGGLGGWVKALVSGPVIFHLWYLYALVGIYLFVPFLRKLWAASGLAEKRLYLAAWAIASSWPTVQAAFGIQTDVLTVYGMDSFFGLSGYLFLGAYLYEAFERPSNRRNRMRYAWINSGLFVVFSLLTMVATFLYSRKQGAPDPLFYDYLSPLVMAASACAFYVLYGLGSGGLLKRRKPQGSSNPACKGALQQVAACTLGVYCIHIFVLNRVLTLPALPMLADSPWWSIPITAVIVFALSLGIVMLMRTLRVFHHVT